MFSELKLGSGKPSSQPADTTQRKLSLADDQPSADGAKSSSGDKHQSGLASGEKRKDHHRHHSPSRSGKKSLDQRRNSPKKDKKKKSGKPRCLFPRDCPLAALRNCGCCCAGSFAVLSIHMQIGDAKPATCVHFRVCHGT